MVKKLVGWLLTFLYRVRVTGIENFYAAGERVLIVANHTSFLDAILLWVYLPDKVTFAINTQIAETWWIKPALKFAPVFRMDPLSPMSVKDLTHYIKGDKKAVIFPEGRITVTGSLMKVYDGAGLIAEKSEASVLPVRIDGAQYTPVSRLQGIVRLRWFPQIRLDILAPRKLHVDKGRSAHDRRQRLGVQMSDIMSDMVFKTGRHHQTLFGALLDARQIHGGGHVLLEDIQRKPVSYNSLILKSFVLGSKIAECTSKGENVGIMLPNMIATLAVLLGLQLKYRTPALLNFGAGLRNIASACRTAEIRTIVSSRKFIANAHLEVTVEALSKDIRIVYLEDISETVGLMDKASALINTLTVNQWHRDEEHADIPAVVLFTSGSEGEPKGAVLSHANLLANREQLGARLDFNAQDKILNVLPMFHSFGLTGGTLLPLLSGMYTFLYPTPLHYRIIPEIAYEINATILFGTNTFLAGYAKHAHPYDFYSVRYVFAGAEKLQEDTRDLWIEKFGLRILEGYGATETSPVLSANTPMFFKAGTVGRFMPGVQWHLENVPGIDRGGRLHVKGPNIMLGYIRPERPGFLEPPASTLGEGWYDTGDIVDLDEDGFITILGRAKRFAKIGGEMVSLGVIEELAVNLWPGLLHAAITASDEKKGEKILLISQNPHADRSEFAKQVQGTGYNELYIPREVRYMKELPLLATGKVDYPALERQLIMDGGLS